MNNSLNAMRRQLPAIEVLVDIARTIGERRLCLPGDSRSDVELFCDWADEFEAQFSARPDAGETYYEDIEDFAVKKATEAGFTPAESQDSVDRVRGG